MATSGAEPLLHTPCPACGRALSLSLAQFSPGDAAGCPFCGGTFSVPAPDQANVQQATPDAAASDGDGDLAAFFTWQALLKLVIVSVIINACLGAVMALVTPELLSLIPRFIGALAVLVLTSLMAAAYVFGLQFNPRTLRMRGFLQAGGVLTVVLMFAGIAGVWCAPWTGTYPARLAGILFVLTVTCGQLALLPTQFRFQQDLMEWVLIGTSGIAFLVAGLLAVVLLLPDPLEYEMLLRGIFAAGFLDASGTILLLVLMKIPDFNLDAGRKPPRRGPPPLPNQQASADDNRGSSSGSGTNAPDKSQTQKNTIVFIVLAVVGVGVVFGALSRIQDVLELLLR